MNVKEIGLRVKRLRKKGGLTCEELARAVGFKDKSSLSKIESGKVAIPMAKIGVFSAALGVSEMFLLGFTKDMNIYKVICMKADAAITSRSRDLVYEAYGECKMAFRLGALSVQEFTELNNRLVTEGLNSPDVKLN